MRISRQCLLIFNGMDLLKAADIPPVKSLVVMSTSSSLEKALSLLLEKGILSAPIVNEGAKIVGVVDLVDIITVLLHLSRAAQEILVSVGLVPCRFSRAIDYSCF